jgi:hypothetical protein
VPDRDLTALNPNRRKILARLGRTCSNQALRRMGPERRYPILLAFLKRTFTDALDEAAVRKESATLTFSNAGSATCTSLLQTFWR